MIYREDYDNAQDYLDALIRRRRLKHRIIATIILLCILGAIGFWLSYYKVRNIQVTGNTRYTNDEITEMVTGGLLSDNSIVLSIKYRNKQITDVPFIEQMDVTVITHDTIKITVYEKSLAGYVTYLGTNFYFGRDGTVVESSREVVEGVPRILGLSFDHIALYEQLPVEDPDIFGRILNVTQLLSKYDLTADSIYYDSSGNMTIYFGDVKVAMGGDDYTDEKLSNVAQILPNLDGRGAGTLKMSSYTPSTKYITYVVKDGKASNITAGASDVATSADGTADDTGTTDQAGTADAAAGTAAMDNSTTAAPAATTPSAQAAAVAGAAAGSSGGTGWESIPETTDAAGAGTADSGPVDNTQAGDATVDAGTADATGDAIIPEEAVEVTGGE